ncbi:hypothetical protein NQ314_021414 [Rhamnusium bicolor]|uniref:MADF domain-containing protein n=1 Tax=Rhamnusium bicolor TaxID=1586634 RepID=A0AAV8WIZ1_9CUCU|nr:hypothetical protein NQ314_021414 [Rhamnusium bicolor]
MDSQGSVDYGFLIELVQANEHLFDLKNKDYKNTKKEATWAEIANVLNLMTEDKKGTNPQVREYLIPLGTCSRKCCFIRNIRAKESKTITATPEIEGLNTPRSLSSSSSNRLSSSLWDDNIIMSPKEHVISENLDEDEVAVEEISTPKEKTNNKYVY